MKPLHTKDIPEFLKRFSNFEDAEFREIKILSAQQILFTFALQDSARAFDWITITLEFSSVSDARLLEANQLSLLDMSEGASLIKEDNLFAFGVGECYNISTIKNSTCYIISTDLKYEEGQY